MAVVVVDVVDEQRPKLAFVPDDGAVEKFVTQRSDPSFGIRVGLRRAWRRHDRPHPGRFELITGRRSGASERVLTTVLLSDVVGSTSEAARLGDSAWRALLDSHDAAARAQLTRSDGVEVNSTGDGFFARFDSPTSAVKCARACGRRVAARSGKRMGWWVMPAGAEYSLWACS